MQESQAESRAMAEEQKEEQVLLNLAKVWAKPITDDATAEAHADALKMLTEKITNARWDLQLDDRSTSLLQTNWKEILKLEGWAVKGLGTAEEQKYAHSRKQMKVALRDKQEAFVNRIKELYEADIQRKAAREEAVDPIGNDLRPEPAPDVPRAGAKKAPPRLVRPEEKQQERSGADQKRFFQKANMLVGKIRADYMTNKKWTQPRKPAGRSARQLERFTKQTEDLAEAKSGYDVLVPLLEQWEQSGNPQFLKQIQEVLDEDPDFLNLIDPADELGLKVHLGPPPDEFRPPKRPRAVPLGVPATRLRKRWGKLGGEAQQSLLHIMDDQEGFGNPAHLAKTTGGTYTTDEHMRTFLRHFAQDIGIPDDMDIGALNNAELVKYTIGPEHGGKYMKKLQGLVRPGQSVAAHMRLLSAGADPRKEPEKHPDEEGKQETVETEDPKRARRAKRPRDDSDDEEELAPPVFKKGQFARPKPRPPQGRFAPTSPLGGRPCKRRRV